MGYFKFAYKMRNKLKLSYIYLNGYSEMFAPISKETSVREQNQVLVLPKVLQLLDLYFVHFYKLNKNRLLKYNM